MRLVLGRDAAVAAWVAARIPQMEGAADFGDCVAIGVESEDGRPLGGVVFSNWIPRYRSIEASFASDTARWLTRNMVRGILSYPFDQLDCQRVTTLTPRHARPARDFLEAFGFKREGLVRRGFGTDDAVISGLLKREWLSSKWMTPPHGEKRPQAPARTGPDRDHQHVAGGERGHGAPAGEA